MASQLVVLEAEHLTMRYRTGTTALRDVSMTMGPGLTGLLGPNGAGKSTFMRILAAIQRPTGGVVRWIGRDIAKEPAALRRALGYLPQDFGAPASFTGAQFVRHMGAMRGLRGVELAKKVEDALSAVHLLDAGHKLVGTYSGGMLRRLGIAQAIVHRPQVLIVDEPTAGLDPEERVQFRKLLADLARDRIAILSTHIVSDIELVAERVAIMVSGQVICDAPIGGLLRDMRGSTWSMVTTPDVYTRLQNDPALRIASAVRRGEEVGLRVVLIEGAPPANAEPLEPSLEDAYLSMTARREGRP